MADISEYMSQSEFAEKVGLTKQRVAQLLNRGQIKDFVMLGRKRVIHKDAVIERMPRSLRKDGCFARKDGHKRRLVAYSIREDYLDALTAEAKELRISYSALFEDILKARYDLED